MRIYLNVLLIALLFCACKSNTTSKIEYDPIVLSAKKSSMYADGVDWEMVNKEFINLSSAGDQKAALQFLINSLGDKHATFRSAEDQSIVASYTGKVEGVDNRTPKFVNEVINDITSTFQYQLLDNDIGYLKVVGIFPGQVAANAKVIRDGLIDLKSKGVSKWILDLRYNGGGDMNPMLSGLAPLIGEGFIGGSVNSKNEMHHEYRVKDGQVFDNDHLITEMENYPIISSDEKLAVLLSRYTVSSGELVAVSIKGRDNTQFIGEATGGYTTGNGWEYVTDELLMCISESVFVDRNNVKYDQKVGVDVASEFMDNVTLDGDQQIEKATSWLLEK